MFAACARLPDVVSAGAAGATSSGQEVVRMKERVGMIFNLRTFTASKASGSPLLLLRRGAKRGAKRTDPIATAH